MRREVFLVHEQPLPVRSRYFVMAFAVYKLSNGAFLALGANRQLFIYEEGYG